MEVWRKKWGHFLGKTHSLGRKHTYSIFLEGMNGPTSRVFLKWNGSSLMGKKNILVWPKGMRLNATEFSKKVKFQRLLPYIFNFKVLSSNSHLNKKSNMFQRHYCTVLYETGFSEETTKEIKCSTFSMECLLWNVFLYEFFWVLLSSCLCPSIWLMIKEIFCCILTQSLSAPLCQLLHTDVSLLSQTQYV